MRPMMKMLMGRKRGTPLGEKNLMDIVKIKEDGVPQEFYVAKHNYENGLNGAGRTLLVRKDCHSNRQWSTNENRGYSSCALDTWLNGAYKALFDADIQLAMDTTKFYSGFPMSTEITELQRDVFLLSCTELGQSYAYTRVEGSALPNADTLTIARLNGSATLQWTRSPYTRSPDRTELVVVLTTKGAVSTANYASLCGVRPAFTLPASTLVDSKGNIL